MVQLTPAVAAAQDARVQEQHERAALNPVGPVTYARMGSKAVKLAGLDDRRQITVTVSGGADGSVLQPMYVGVQKPLKDAIRAAFAAFILERYTVMAEHSIILANSRVTVLLAECQGLLHV